MFCTAKRMPSSLARMPYETEIEVSTRAVAVMRGGSLPTSPVYQDTVLAAVPATSAVAVSNGGPTTRCGTPSKKLSAAASAEAAVSDVLASLPTAVVSDVCRLAAVVAASTPMVNSFGPGVPDVVAVSVTISLLPSGKFNRNWTVWPWVGSPSGRQSSRVAHRPDRSPRNWPSVELMLASLKPNGGARDVFRNADRGRGRR